MRNLALFVTAALVCHLAGSAWAQTASPGGLGSYERAALDRALAARDLTLDPDPAGKVVERIHVVNQDVFAPGEGLTWFNILHITTRERVIERLVLLRPGQVWSDITIKDTLRRLRDQRFSTLALIVPVVSATPGRVDLLVVTRDVWSLRTNTDYEIQNGTLTRFILAPSESNLFGLRKQLYLLFDLRQGEYSLGGSYLDTALVGSRLRLSARSTAVFGRQSDEIEGSRTAVSLTYPLWSLTRRWGASLSVAHFDAVERDFQGGQLRRRDLASTPDVVEEIPYLFNLRESLIDAQVTWSRGLAIKHYLSLGYEFAIARPTFYQDVPSQEQCGATALADCLAAVRTDLFPRSELSSAVYAEYSLFTPRFRTFRNVDTYDFPEERQFGPDLSAGVALARREIGSEDNFVRLSGRLGWTFAVGENGFARALASAESRVQSDKLIDNRVSATLLMASPSLGKWLRVVGRAEASAYLEERANRFFTLGGGSGLRGFGIGAFAGKSRVRGNLEVRSGSFKAWFTRMGGIAFWDLGHAADGFDNLDIQHNVGLGGRMVIPQAQTAVFRLDWAVPLTGDDPGFGRSRFVISFSQAFDTIGSSPVPDTPL